MADSQFHRLTRKSITVAKYLHVIDNNGKDGHVTREDLENRILSLIPQVPDYHDYPLDYTNQNLPNEALLSVEEPDQSGYRRLTVEDLEKRFLDKNNPVGTVRIFQGNNTNPSSLFGVGSWSRTAAGRAIVGAGSAVDENNIKRTVTDGQKLGQHEVTLTAAQIPRHSHNMVHSNRNSSNSNAAPKPYRGYNYTVGGAHSTEDAGGDQPHTNIQPSEVYTIWKRVV